MTPTLFSWGYYGWGNHTQNLVEAVDAVEASRGFEPPFFVDVRIRRSVRAAGFNGPAFENLLGQKQNRRPETAPLDAGARERVYQDRDRASDQDRRSHGG